MTDQIYLSKDDVISDLNTALNLVLSYNNILQRLSAPDPNILTTRELLKRYMDDISGVRVKSGAFQILLSGYDITNDVSEYRDSISEIQPLRWRDKIVRRMLEWCRHRGVSV